MSLRATHALINLKAIRKNIMNLKKKANNKKVLIAVKADGYGHGAFMIAKMVENEKLVDYLAVAEISEAVILRNKGIKMPILKFGYVFDNETDDIFEYNIIPTVFDIECAIRLNEKAKSLNKKLKIHIKVDSGMGRIGVVINNAFELIKKINELSNIDIEGLYTHFPISDEFDKTFSNIQIEKFKKLINTLKKNKLEIPIKHMANSGATLDIEDSYMDMIRPGISIYGFYPSTETTESVKLIPAMTLRTRISYIKKVPANTSISYGRTYFTKKESYIATLPLGYADGYNRLLSNRGIVVINGKTYPVVGRVCMDQICVDLGDNSNITVGDIAILFGNYNETPFTVYEIAQICNTITYEITCNINKRAQRLYIDE